MPTQPSPPPPPPRTSSPAMTYAMIGVVAGVVGFITGIPFGTFVVASRPEPAAAPPTAVAEELDNEVIPESVDPTALEPEDDERSLLAKLREAASGAGGPLDGEGEVPELWRRIEGRVLGLKSGNWAMFPYLPGEDGFGVTRKLLIEHFRESTPRLRVEDSSNGANGESCVITLSNSLSILASGTWNNVHTVALLGNWPGSGGDSLASLQFATVGSSLARLASGDASSEDLSITKIADGLQRSLAMGEHTTVTRDGVVFDLSATVETALSNRPTVYAWYIVRSEKGPIGRGGEVGSDDSEDDSD